MYKTNNSTACLNALEGVNICYLVTWIGSTDFTLSADNPKFLLIPFFQSILETFPILSKDSSRMDIVFEVYLGYNIKKSERNRRSKLDSIETSIATVEQQLPVDMNRFWSSSQKQNDISTIIY